MVIYSLSERKAYIPDVVIVRDLLANFTLDVRQTTHDLRRALLTKGVSALQ